MSKHGNDKQRDGPNERNGPLAIPLPFDEALKAALEIQPAPPPPKKQGKKAEP